MSVRSSRPCHSPARRSFFCVAWLVVCALLLNSLDNCVAHCDLPSASVVTQAAERCLDVQAGVCDCLSDHPLPQHGCGALDEIAFRASSQIHHDQQIVAPLSATVATLPATPQLIALSGCLHGRAGPPPAPLFSVFLRRALPARAPPVSI